MNYVAHLLLTYPHREISLGNLLGDLLSNKASQELVDNFKLGITVHRAIDHHTDNHDSVREVVRLLRSQHSKYAPVVSDILFDRVLVLNWEKYSDITFSEFEAWVYDMILSQMDSAPEQRHNQLKGMVHHRWLHQYASTEGLQYVLDRMDKRARFPSNFGAAIQDFDMHYEAMQNAFSELFPDLSNVVNGLLQPEI